MLFIYSPAGLVNIKTWAGVTSLKPEQAWFPRLDCPGAEGAGEDMPANEPLLGPLVPGPLWMEPQPPDPGGPSYS